MRTPSGPPLPPRSAAAVRLAWNGERNLPPHAQLLIEVPSQPKPLIARRLALIEHVRGSLARAGYFVSERCDIRPVSFDVVARRDNDLLVLKVLTNIDALGERVANEMKVLARFLGGRAIVTGEKSGAGVLEQGVLYYRHGIPILHVESLIDCVLQDVPPFVYAAPGGYYCRLDAAALARARHMRRVSLGELAQVAGVSRRTISMYEDGMSATLEAALRLEEFLGEALVRPLMDARGEAVPQEKRPDPAPEAAPADPSTPDDAVARPDWLETTDGFEREVYTALHELGYEVVPTARSPFNALSQERQTLILTSVTREDGATIRKARLVASLSAVTERPGVFFARRHAASHASWAGKNWPALK